MSKNDRTKLSLEQLNRINVEEFKSSEKRPLVYILDDIRSLQNVGTFFRTGDAFRVSKIYLCGITGQPPHRDINKTALGSTESVEWEHKASCSELIHDLKSNGYRIACIEQTSNSTSLENYTYEQEYPYAFVFGNEVFGVKQEIVDLADVVLEIPQFGTKHSLNVAVSCGIVSWDFHSKTKGKDLKNPL